MLALVLAAFVPSMAQSRQVMIETEHRYGGKMEVLLYGEDAIWVFESAADLLPLIFVSENLKG